MAKAKAHALPKGKAKAKAKAKGSLAKGRALMAKQKSLTKGNDSGNKSLSKGNNVKKEHLKNKLNKSALAKLGNMSLKEKIDKVTEENEDAEEAASQLRESLTAKERQSAWGKMQTAMKKDPEEAERVNKMSKKEIGLYACMHLLKVHKPKFMQVQNQLEQGISLTKGEKWLSKKAMLKEFDDDEFQAHLRSGRIRWREDPLTWGCWQYMDTGDLTKVTHVKKSQTHTVGQEYDAEDEEEWDKHFNKDLGQHLDDVGKGGKGGKGNSLAKGKGKGKGKRQLAIEDGSVEDEGEGEGENNKEKTPEEEWQEVVKKARRARDSLGSEVANLEEGLTKANKTGRLSKVSKKDAEHLMAEAGTLATVMKDILLRREKSMSLTKAKDTLVKAATKCKELKDEKKEMWHMANKATSVASSSKRK